MGTVVGNKASFGQIQERNKIGVGMACYAPHGVRVKRVRKWDRAYPIVFGSTAMTALATDGIAVMCRGKIIWNNECPRYGIN
ncbi:MAG TPA: hypothetical protein VK187_04340 [Geobacteraceae bacterium]|nr:hypothetical protein [Geobacteraceae bacterium]